jgi:hypothetical protein
MRQMMTAQVRLDGGKATSSGAARSGLLAKGSATIEFLCIGASLRRMIMPNISGIRGMSVNNLKCHWDSTHRWMTRRAQVMERDEKLHGFPVAGEAPCGL